METENISLEINARGLACPMPIFKAKKGLQTVELGQVVEIICTDPGSLADFKAFANSTGHELLLSEQNGGDYRFLLRRTK